MRVTFQDKTRWSQSNYKCHNIIINNTTSARDYDDWMRRDVIENDWKSIDEK